MTLRRDALEHRTLIIHTAKDLFDIHGVEPVTMHQIAKAAGIGQGTLYRNYANKGELCQDILRENTSSLEFELRQLLESNPHAPVGWMLEQFFYHMLDFLEEKYPWLEAIHACGCAGSAASYHQSPFYHTGHAWLSRLLEEAIASGECQADLDPVFMADAILAAADPDLFVFQRQVRHYSLDRLKANFARFYLQSLFPVPSNKKAEPHA